jgi:non-ribosomal peptide synthetase component E (peptide arylation enzyme)
MLRQRLTNTVKEKTENTAIVYGDLNISYKQLGQSITSLSDGLETMGIGKLALRRSEVIAKMYMYLTF